MRPGGDQKCEGCGRDNLKVLFDTRARRALIWPKGHWVFLCPACYLLNGSGYDYEDLVIYERFQGRYFEVWRQRDMKVEEIALVVAKFSAKVEIDEEWKVILLGEIAIQMAMINDQLKANGELSIRVLENLQELNTARIGTTHV